LGRQDTEVLGRVRDLGLGAALYMAAVARYLNRNIALCQAARIVRPRPRSQHVRLPT
jgi:hypothetical protein